MRSSTRYPTDPFNIFLVLVLLGLGTRFRGASVAGFTNQPVKAAPAPQTPAEESDVQGPGEDPQDEGLEHSEIPQIPPDDWEPTQDQQENPELDTDDDAVTVPAETPASPITTEPSIEKPPMTLPADQSIKVWPAWPADKR